MDAGDDVEVDQPDGGGSVTATGSDQDSGGRSEPSSLSHGEIWTTLSTVEKDSQAIAQSFSSLFVSLRATISEVTGSSVDHMSCFGDGAGRLQKTALDAATKGNRLNKEIEVVGNLAARLKHVRRNVDALDTAVNKLLRPP